MLDYRFQSLCGGHLQLILLLGDVYFGLLIPISLWRSPSVDIIIRRCLCWIIDSSLDVEVTFS